MHLGERANKREAKPRSFVRRAGVVAQLHKGIAKTIELIGWDSHAGIFDGYRNALSVPDGAGRHASALGCELGGVRKKVEQDLLDRAPVCADMQRLRRNFLAQRDAALLGAFAHKRRAFVDQGANVYRFSVKLEFARLDL